VTILLFSYLSLFFLLFFLVFFFDQFQSKKLLIHNSCLIAAWFLIIPRKVGNMWSNCNCGGKMRDTETEIESEMETEEKGRGTCLPKLLETFADWVAFSFDDQCALTDISISSNCGRLFGWFNDGSSWVLNNWQSVEDGGEETMSTDWNRRQLQILCALWGLNEN